MADCLENVFDRKKIKVIYNNNKTVLLSGNVTDGIRTLRIHSIFKNCPNEISDAIYKYCTEKGCDVRIDEEEEVAE